MRENDVFVETKVNICNNKGQAALNNWQSGPSPWCLFFFRNWLHGFVRLQGSIAVHHIHPGMVLRVVSESIAFANLSSGTHGATLKLHLNIIFTSLPCQRIFEQLPLHHTTYPRPPIQTLNLNAWAFECKSSSLWRAVLESGWVSESEHISFWIGSHYRFRIHPHSLKTSSSISISFWVWICSLKNAEIGIDAWWCMYTHIQT